MVETIINGGNKMYISELPEFKNGFPRGVINKTSADVGGTYWAINCDVPYIVVVPTLDLLSSICNDKNNTKEVFRVDGNTRKFHYKNQDKIVVTYDSFYKLTSWIVDKSKYKVLIDEYHLLLETIGYREDAINDLFDCITEYDDYSFITATPMSPEFEPSIINSLPHYKVVWDNMNVIKPIRIKCGKLQQSLIKIIKYFLDDQLSCPDVSGVETKVNELYIYLNSVQSIKQILDTLDISQDDVKVCCSYKHRNRLILGKYEISDVTEPNKRLNFFTSKCFQGCNLFTDNGLVIVVSDANKDSMVIDLSCDLLQIAGRIRKSSNNCFSNTLVHLYTTNSSIMTDEEFEEMMNNKRGKADLLIAGSQKLSDEERAAFVSTMVLDYELVSSYDSVLKKSELKEKFFYYKQAMRKQYVNGISVRGSYHESFLKTTQSYWNDFVTKLSSITTVNYKDLLLDYYKNFDKTYELEYPEFAEYKKYLTIKEIRTLSFVKDKLIKTVESKKNLKHIFSKLRTGFISCAFLKEWLKIEFDKLGIILSPKASMVEQYRNVKKTKEKGVNGYIIY